MNFCFPLTFQTSHTTSIQLRHDTGYQKCHYCSSLPSVLYAHFSSSCFHHCPLTKIFIDQSFVWLYTIMSRWICGLLSVLRTVPDTITSTKKYNTCFWCKKCIRTVNNILLWYKSLVLVISSGGCNTHNDWRLLQLFSSFCFNSLFGDLRFLRFLNLVMKSSQKTSLDSDVSCLSSRTGKWFLWFCIWVSQRSIF